MTHVYNGLADRYGGALKEWLNLVGPAPKVLSIISLIIGIVYLVTVYKEHAAGVTLAACSFI